MRQWNCAHGCFPFWSGEVGSEGSATHLEGENESPTQLLSVEHPEAQRKEGVGLSALPTRHHVQLLPRACRLSESSE